MSFFRMFLLGLLILLAALAWKASLILPMATGYSAKTLCSEYFVAGRKDQDQIWSDIGDLDPRFSWASYELDIEAGVASTFVGPGLVRASAVYRDGLGCTIAVDVDPVGLKPLPFNQHAKMTDIAPLPEAFERNSALEAALDEAFSEPASTSHRQTRAVIVLHRGQIVAERYAPGFDRNTPLIGWSMTKSITNNLIGMLVKHGLLSLDDPAPVPEWSGPGDPRARITLRHLLQMSSGLDFEEVYEPGSDATNMLFTEYSAGAYAADSPMVHEPGTHWSYSSGSSNILGRIIRDSVGGTAAAVHEFARSRLFKPLGLSSMIIEMDASGAPVGSSFSYATARDWARLGQFWLQDGIWQGERLLPEGWMNWSINPAPSAPLGEYGAQFWLNSGLAGRHRAFPSLPDSVYHANGFAGQSVVVFPEEEIVAVRLGFTTDNSWNLGAFLEAVYAALGKK